MNLEVKKYFTVPAGWRKDCECFLQKAEKSFRLNPLSNNPSTQKN